MSRVTPSFPPIWGLTWPLRVGRHRGDPGVVGMRAEKVAQEHLLGVWDPGPQPSTTWWIQECAKASLQLAKGWGGG